MSVIYVLIPIAILLTALGIYLFFWAVKTEQFDDLEKQGLSILFDDTQSTPKLKTEAEEPLKSITVKDEKNDDNKTSLKTSTND
jgi:cbb3-type cytochrome oxidase maturation protein